MVGCKGESRHRLGSGGASESAGLGSGGASDLVAQGGVFVIIPVVIVVVAEVVAKVHR
jgi:hypothetical protein